MRKPQILTQVVWVELCKAATLCLWIAYQCAQTLFICLMWMQEADWGGCQPQQWHYAIILATSDPEPQNMSQWCDYNFLRLLPYAHGQHINVLKHFVYVQCGCRKQFEVAVSLNHDVMTSFWLHKWPKTPKCEPSSVGMTIWCYCHVPMDTIWMCSNTFYMSNVDVGSSLRWL